MSGLPIPTKPPRALEVPDRSRRFSSDDPAKTAASARGMSGLDAMRGIIAGTLAPPTVARLLDITLVEADEGRATSAR